MTRFKSTLTSGIRQAKFIFLPSNQIFLVTDGTFWQPVQTFSAQTARTCISDMEKAGWLSLQIHVCEKTVGKLSKLPPSKSSDDVAADLHKTDNTVKLLR